MAATGEPSKSSARCHVHIYHQSVVGMCSYRRAAIHLSILAVARVRPASSGQMSPLRSL